MAKKKAAGRGRPASGKKVLSSDGRVTPKFPISLPAEERAALEVMAKRNVRSVAAEILVAIRHHIARDGQP